MRIRSLWILVLFSTSLILQFRTHAQQQDVLAITHAVIIDGTGRAPLLHGTILVRNERVQQIGPASDVPVPENAQVIDAH
jgi:imidazolonepropionase-like amidohydrolase